MSHKYGETRCFNDDGYVNTVREDGSVYIETQMLSKNKNIIEKLGITKAPWGFNKNGYDGAWQIKDGNGDCFQSNEDYYPWNSDNEADWVLQATAPEMLEALIESYKTLEYSEYGIFYSAIMKGVIEKATDKSWEEIKELIK